LLVASNPIELVFNPLKFPNRVIPWHCIQYISAQGRLLPTEILCANKEIFHDAQEVLLKENIVTVRHSIFADKNVLHDFAITRYRRAAQLKIFHSVELHGYPTFREHSLFHGDYMTGTTRMVDLLLTHQRLQGLFLEIQWTAGWRDAEPEDVHAFMKFLAPLHDIFVRDELFLDFKTRGEPFYTFFNNLEQSPEDSHPRFFRFLEDLRESMGSVHRGFRGGQRQRKDEDASNELIRKYKGRC